MALNSSSELNLFIFASSYGAYGGYLIHAEPYCERDKNTEETELGQGPDIVLRLIDKCKLPKQATVTFENLLASLPLLDNLSEDSIYGLGTSRKSIARCTTDEEFRFTKERERSSWLSIRWEKHRDSMAWQ